MTILADHLPTASHPRPRLDPCPAPPAPPHADRALALAALLEHGDDLLSLARLLTGSFDEARTVISTVVQAVHTGGCPPRGTEVSQSVLAAAVFRACRARPDVDPSATGSGNESIDWLARISAQQRSAVALYLHGDLTPGQIGTLLDLPVRGVSLLVLSALHELADADLVASRRRRTRSAS